MCGERNEACFDYAVAFNRWSMKLLGLWPLGERFSNLKWSLVFAVAFFFLFPSMARMMTIAGWRSIIEQAVLTVPLCLLLMKFAYIKARATNFKTILEAMIEDWSKFAYLPDGSRKAMVEHARRGRIVNIMCIVCMLLSIAGYMTLPSGSKWSDGLNSQNESNRKLPTEGLYPFDSKKSPVYELLYASQAIVSCFYSMTIFSIDCFLSVIIFHACGQLTILSGILKEYNGRTRHVKRGSADIHACACLRCIVKRHVYITKFMDIVEKSFNEFVLLQLLGNCFILLAEGYELVTYAAHNDILGFLTFVVYTMTVTYNLFIYCYMGECIIEKSEDIADVAYATEWNTLPRYLAEPLVLLMIRSRKPCRITAGRFAVMTLSYYKSILATSMSYISILRAIK
ncbi:hypothetical protein KM043_002496 [Ampulex compressa]|nr:hypothetical protein KM043_002496 [Ampulex compressa]